jgi:pimeloyl-ACP methyl ester carboxylesterase
VLYVHGLWMSGAESLVLRHRLARQGFLLRSLRYSSVFESRDVVVERCARLAAALAVRHGVPVHFIGHSLGGLIIYRLFERGLPADAGFDAATTRVVFLGTPALASRTALRLAASRFGRRLLRGIAAAELLAADGRHWNFGPPLCVIAGNRARGMGRLLGGLQGENDGTVEVAETRLPGAHVYRVLPSTHSGLLLSATVYEAVLDFLTAA